MEHDLIGRMLAKGFDYQASLEAYRKARQLDPKETDPRTKGTQSDYAKLLEYDADGSRYTEKSHMEQAITEFKNIRERDEEAGKKYDDFVLYDLWYLRRYQELMAQAAVLPGTDTRRGLILAAVAVDKGVDAAVKKSMDITSDEQRSKSLANAASLLLGIQKYTEASEMFSVSSKSQGNSAQILTFTNALKNTRPLEQIRIAPSDPRSAVQGLLISTLSPDARYETSMSFMSKSALKSVNLVEDKLAFRQAMVQIKRQAEKSGLTAMALADIVISSARYSVEGDDALGYRITIETLGGAIQHAYVIREDGQYKCLKYSLGAEMAEEIGWEVLSRLDKNDLPAARKWLDWARDAVHISGSDDPLSGQPFPHFWAKGQEGDANAIRTAALVLLPSKLVKGEYLSSLVAMRDATKADAERNRLTLVLAYAYSAQERWSELLPAAEELIKSAPDSLTAFNFLVKAYLNLKQFDDWQKVLQVNLQKHPDEMGYVRSAIQLARYRGDFSAAQALMKPVIERGKASDEDLNLYGWDALSRLGPISSDVIEAAERANERTKNSNFAILHTLACLYAQNGKGAQARELLLKAMEAGSLEEPNAAVWFGFGKIAEEYGERQIAQQIYARVEKPKTDGPGSNYSLAQQRLQVLKKASVAVSTNEGK